MSARHGGADLYPSTEAEIGGSMWVWGKPGLQS